MKLSTDSYEESFKVTKNSIYVVCAWNLAQEPLMIIQDFVKDSLGNYTKVLLDVYMIKII